MLRMRNLAQIVALVVVVLVSGPSSMASPAATSPSLGMAKSFAVLAATTITNVPPSHISGDVGLSPAPGSGYGGGFSAADMVTGTIYTTSAGGPAGSVVSPTLLTAAKTDLVATYNALAGQGCTTSYGGTKDLVGLTLVPGVYCAGAFTLSGVLTLNGVITDVWIFKSADTLITSPGGVAKVQFLNKTSSACNVWWWVASSATIDTNTAFMGNIVALTSITLNTGASIDGRALARNGAVTMQSNTISICALTPSGITTQIHNASHANVTSTSQPIGTVVHDMATVTGTVGITPTGTVSFTVYANQICTGTATFAGAVALNGVGVAHPSDTAILSDTGLSYLAHYGGDTNYTPADGPCEPLAAIPTAVELLYFQANPLNAQQVQLKWATALEVDNFGFNLYRANVDDVNVAIAGLPIHFEPATTQGSGSGATYVYVDTAPSAGPWWYWLSDVDTKGRETFHNTPIKITVQPNISLPYHVYLPFMAKGSGN
jgi:Ice-binding-like